MAQIIALLVGKKTYIVAAVGLILAGLKATGQIDESTYQTILGVLAMLGLGTIRSAVAANHAAVEEAKTAVAENTAITKDAAQTTREVDAKLTNTTSAGPMRGY